MRHIPALKTVGLRFLVDTKLDNPPPFWTDGETTWSAVEDTLIECIEYGLREVCFGSLRSLREQDRESDIGDVEKQEIASWFPTFAERGGICFMY